MCSSDLARAAIARAVRGMRVGGVDGIVVMELRSKTAGASAVRAGVRAHTLVDTDRDGAAEAALGALKARLQKAPLPRGARVVASLRVSRGTVAGAW